MNTASVVLVAFATLFGSANALDCPADDVVNDGDTAWMIVASALVLFMTPGLAFFYGGLVKKKNVVNTLMMSYVAMGVVMFQWVLFGYSFAFGWHDAGFGDFKWGGFKGVLGVPNKDYSPTIPHLAYANFQMMFAVITPALISGSVVERISFRSYIIFIFLWTTLVYDPLAHWVWSAKSEGVGADCVYKFGWLRDMGAIDFAGGTVIHISSGFSALTASYIVGKRKDYDYKQNVSSPNSVPFVLLGAAMLWFGWIGFNGGSSLAANAVAVLATANTSIAAAMGFLTWMLLDWIVAKKPSAVGAATGSVAGLVAITPASGYILPGWALMVGFVVSVVCYAAVRYKRFLRADDALDAFVCHGIGGVVGALMTGLFATLEANPGGSDGAFYGNGKLFGLQLLAVVVAIVISVVGTAVILLALKFSPIGLVVDDETQETGMDANTHKEDAESYDEASLKKLHSNKNLRAGNNANNNSEELPEVTIEKK